VEIADVRPAEDDERQGAAEVGEAAAQPDGSLETAR
jgi:hypothetical protein